MRPWNKVKVIKTNMNWSRSTLGIIYNQQCFMDLTENASEKVSQHYIIKVMFKNVNCHLWICTQDRNGIILSMYLNTCWSKVKVTHDKYYHAQFNTHYTDHVCQDSSLVRAPEHDWKVASSNPGRSGGRIFSGRVNFVCWLLFGVHSISVLQHWHVKDPGHSAKSAGGRLYMDMHTSLTKWSWSGLTMPLSGIV